MFAQSFLSRRVRGWSLGVVLAGAATVLLAQSAPTSSAGQLAALSEDVQLLTRKVSQLSLDVESLRQSNAELQKQLLTQREVQAMIQNAVNASRADARGDTSAATASLRKEIVDEVTRQITALGDQMNQKLVQVAKIAPPPRSNPNAPTPKPTDVGITYVVQKNDTLSKLASTYHTTVAEIASANGMADPNRGLKEGQTIFIPQKTPIAPPPAPPANP
jgi:LysM repeat protein